MRCTEEPILVVDLRLGEFLLCEGCGFDEPLGWDPSVAKTMVLHADHAAEFPVVRSPR